MIHVARCGVWRESLEQDMGSGKWGVGEVEWVRGATATRWGRPACFSQRSKYLIVAFGLISKFGLIWPLTRPPLRIWGPLGAERSRSEERGRARPGFLTS